MAKSKTQTLKDYQTDLEAATKFRKEQKHEDTWRLLIDMYRGRHFSANELADGDKIMVNISFSTKNVVSPTVSINYPKFSVLPRNPEDAINADIAEQGLNYWWKRYKFHPEVRRAVDDWIILGHGWVKVGYRYETKDVPISPETRQQFLQEAIAEVDAYIEETGDFSHNPSMEDLEASLPTTESVVAVDEPFVERVSPFDILVDPEAISPEDMRWICQKIVMPLEIAKANKAYKSSVRNKLETDSALNPRWRDEQRIGTKVADSLKRVTIYEFYDLQNEKFCVFTKDAEEFLVDPTDLPYIYGNPFVMLRNYDVPDEFYPIGDLEMIEPIQRELNETRSDMMNHRKRYRRAWLAKRQHLDQQARDALESNEDNRIVYVDDDVPLNDVIQPIPVSSVDVGMYSYSQVILNDVELVSGVSDYQRGGGGEIRRTATEAGIIADSTSARSQDKLSTIETWLSRVAHHVLALMQTYMEGEQLIRIVGDEGMYWQEFTREDIVGDFDFEVEAGSTQPRNETQRRQQALMLANVMQPYIGVILDPAQMVKYVLKEGFGISDPERFIAPPPMVGPDGMPMQPDVAGNAVAGQPQPNQGDITKNIALPMSGANVDPQLLMQMQNGMM